MNKVEKIKAEIERKIGELKQFKKASYEIGLYDGYMFALSFIDFFLDTEKDFSTKESVIPFGASDSELMESTYFIPQGCYAVIDGNKVIIKKGEDPVSNDLEEAAREWLKPKLDKSYINYGEAKMMELTHFDGYAMLDATEFGAQWQKEQLLNNAIEREVKVDAGGYPYIDVTELYDYDKDRPLAKEGDKVKLIIIMK